MKRLLASFLALLCLTGDLGARRWIPKIAATSSITADLIIDAAGQTNGSTLTTTILVNSSHSSYSTSGNWSLTPSTPTGFTIQAPATALHSSFLVNGTTYPAGSTTSHTLQLVNSNSFTYATLNMPSGKRICSVAGFVTLGAPIDGFQLYDLIRFSGIATGQFVVMQLNNGNGSSPRFDINIETNPGGVTTHSSYTRLTQGAKYWFTLKCNYTSGTASLTMYETSGWTQVVNLTTTQTTGEDIVDLRIGNGENGSGTGNNVFEWIVVDWTNALQPLGP